MDEDEKYVVELRRLTKTQSHSEILFLAFAAAAVIALMIAALEPETPTSLYDSWHLITGASAAAAIRQWTVIKDLRSKRSFMLQTLIKRQIIEVVENGE